MHGYRVREARVVYTTQVIEIAPVGRQVVSPESALQLLQAVRTPDGSRLVEEGVEHFGLLLLDTKHRVTGVSFVSKGTLDGTMLHPREFWRVAILAGAAAVIAFHNHPSGDPTPSPHDQDVTHRLKACSAVIGIELLDHIVVCADAGYSITARKQISEP